MLDSRQRGPEYLAAVKAKGAPTQPNVCRWPGLYTQHLLDVVHLISYDGGHHVINLQRQRDNGGTAVVHRGGLASLTAPYLFHIQRADGRGVADAGFADHRFDVLDLRCDAGHLHRVAVVVRYV